MEPMQSLLSSLMSEGRPEGDMEDEEPLLPGRGGLEGPGPPAAPLLQQQLRPGGPSTGGRVPLSATSLASLDPPRARGSFAAPSLDRRGSFAAAPPRPSALDRRRSFAVGASLAYLPPAPVAEEGEAHVGGGPSSGLLASLPHLPNAEALFLEPHEIRKDQLRRASTMALPASAAAAAMAAAAAAAMEAGRAAGPGPGSGGGTSPPQRLAHPRMLRRLDSTVSEAADSELLGSFLVPSLSHPPTGGASGTSGSGGGMATACSASSPDSGGPLGAFGSFPGLPAASQLALQSGGGAGEPVGPAEPLSAEEAATFRSLARLLRALGHVPRGPGEPAGWGARLGSIALAGTLGVAVPVLTLACIERSEHNLFGGYVAAFHFVNFGISYFFLCRITVRHTLAAILFIDGSTYSAEYVLGEKSPVLRAKFQRMLASFPRSFLLGMLLPATAAHAAQGCLSYGPFFWGLPAAAPLAGLAPAAAAGLRAALFVLQIAAFAFRVGNFLFIVAVFVIVCDLFKLKMTAYSHLLRGHCESCPALCFDKHLMVRKGLSLVSHRFRLFLALSATSVVAQLFFSMYGMLIEEKRLSLANTGDLVVAACVAAFGAFVCLRAATAISHRCQGMVTLVAQLHARATLRPEEGADGGGGWGAAGGAEGGAGARPAGAGDGEAAGPQDGPGAGGSSGRAGGQAADADAAGVAEEMAREASAASSHRGVGSGRGADSRRNSSLAAAAAAALETVDQEMVAAAAAATAAASSAAGSAAASAANVPPPPGPRLARASSAVGGSASSVPQRSRSRSIFFRRADSFAIGAPPPPGAAHAALLEDLLPPLSPSELYQQRAAFLAYLQQTRAGFSVYGFVLERGFLQSFQSVLVSLALFVIIRSSSAAVGPRA